jgi:hypothetical protein
MTTASEAIREAMVALGGEAEAREVKVWIEGNYPGRWADITVQMADLTYPGNSSSTYPLDQRILERIARGRYRMRSGA